MRLFNTKGSEDSFDTVGKQAKTKLLNEDDFSDKGKKVANQITSKLREGVNPIKVEDFKCKSSNGEFYCESLSNDVMEKDGQIFSFSNIAIGYEGINTVTVKTDKIKTDKGKLIT